MCEFVADDALTLGAAFAYYAILSLGPVLIILIWIGAMLSDHAQETVATQAVALMGAEAGAAIRTIMEQSHKHAVAGSVSGIISFVMLLVGAVGAFGQLQHSVNRLWDLETIRHRGMRSLIRRTVLSLLMIVFLALLLPVSVAVTACLSWIFGKWIAINAGVSLLVFTVVFGLVFKYLPDAQISWKDACAGAIVTGVLFECGRFGIGLYLGRSAIASAYGAAGSLILVLLWLYYSAIIFFFGAELTQVWAKASGRTIKPRARGAPVQCDNL